MQSHIKRLGMLHIVFGMLGIFGALVVLVTMGGVAAIMGSSQNADTPIAAPIVGGIGGILFFVVLAISLPGLIGGFGLIKFASWSRMLMIVISALELLSVPLGTILGIYGLWVLTRPETERLLSGRAL